MSRRCRVAVVSGLALLGALVGLADGAAPARTAVPCVLPDTRPLWIDYAEGSVPKEVRDVFARRGTILAASGTALPKTYRDKGATTVFFVLNLPRLIGEPGKPADPGTIDAMVAQTYERAVASTECTTPIIGLNELLGPAAPVPWTPNVRQYRANVLALVRGLADRGARPALLIHGNPVFGGEAAVWWRQVGAVADVVYEAYYNAPVIMKLGRIVGTRRIRLGMRNVADKFVATGIQRSRIGFVLGFQVAPGAAGREGLSPTSDWLRYVKWNALAARQVAAEVGATTIWSWGWANFGPQSVDPDKPAAACVYLWARDTALCDGPAVAGNAFNASRLEGTITLPGGALCVSASGRVTDWDVSALTPVVHARDVALTALFSRLALDARIPVTRTEVLAAEQRVIDREFSGARVAYIQALASRGASIAVARGVLGDVIRRAHIRSMLSGGALKAPAATTPLTWSADTASAEADTATCRGDVLPGFGDFPASNAREVSPTPLLRALPFLGADNVPPGAPNPLKVTGGSVVTLDWADARAPDVVGYVVLRKVSADAPFVRLNRLWLTRSTFADRSVEPDSRPIYAVRAVDTSGNVGPASTEVALTLPPGV